MRKHFSPLAGLLLLSAAAPLGASDGPAAIAVPPGHRLLCTLHAAGVQVYRSAPGDTGLAWVPDGVLATLTDDTGVAAYHYDGPTWEGVDGGRVVADKAVPVASAPAPDPAHDIPWLRVAVRRDGEDPGRLVPAVYVQRTDTHGGTPPATPPIRTGTKVGVPYTATYRFFAKAD